LTKHRKAGWKGTISGVKDPASIMGVPVENIAAVKGVRSRGEKKVKIECPLQCGKRVKVSVKKNGKISEKDKKARLRQHIQLSNVHKNLRLPPDGSPEKLKQVLKKLELL